MVHCRHLYTFIAAEVERTFSLCGERPHCSFYQVIVSRICPVFPIEEQSLPYLSALQLFFKRGYLLMVARCFSTRFCQVFPQLLQLRQDILYEFALFSRSEIIFSSVSLSSIEENEFEDLLPKIKFIRYFM